MIARGSRRRALHLVTILTVVAKLFSIMEPHELIQENRDVTQHAQPSRSPRTLLRGSRILSELSNSSRQYSVLVAVLSARENRRRRARVRNWARELKKEARMRNLPEADVFFIVGNADLLAGGSVEVQCPACTSYDLRSIRNGTYQDKIQADLLSEQEKHGDIFPVAIVDTYKNSAHKMKEFYSSFGRLRTRFWALVKADDDVILYPSLLFDALSASPVRTAVIDPDALVWWGYFRRNETVNRVPDQDAGARLAHDAHAKTWTVRREDYARDRYPDYASGTSHILSRTLVAWFGDNVGELSTSVWMEDVAHGLWFENAAAKATSQRVCKVFDYRFARSPHFCCRNTIAIGTTDEEESQAVRLAVHQMPKLCNRSAATMLGNASRQTREEVGVDVRPYAQC